MTEKDFLYYYIRQVSSDGYYHCYIFYVINGEGRGGIIQANFTDYKAAIAYIEKCHTHNRKFDFSGRPIKKFICFGFDGRTYG